MVRERSSANSGRPCPSPPTLLATTLQVHLLRSRMAQGKLIYHFVHQSGQRGEFACQRCVVASPPWPASRTGLATAAPAVLEACPHAAKRRAARPASESRARLPAPPPLPHLRLAGPMGSTNRSRSIRCAVVPTKILQAPALAATQATGPALPKHSPGFLLTPAPHSRQPGAAECLRAPSLQIGVAVRWTHG